jgi:DNA-binding NarL/FixJ family response regulator/signal transduction histidine kinase
MGSVEPMIINDTVESAAAEFLEIPAVSVFNMRAYVGVPIVLSTGRVYGTLCALDRSPKQNSRRQVEALLILARLLASQIDRRELGIAEERNRLAREIHDTLAQSLSALALDLAMHASNLRREAPQLEPEATAMQELAREALRDVRRSIWNLQPGTLDGRTLPEAISHELSGLERFGINGTIEVRGSAEALPPPVETAVLRIAQEGLANVRKHSGADAVVVTLEYQADEILLRVDDNGRGLDPASAGAPRPTGGFGITSMRERARALGGDLDIRRRPAGGVALLCVLPRSGPAVARAESRPEPSAAQRPARTAGKPPSSGRPHIRAAIADDHMLVREGLRRLLEDMPDVIVVAEADNGDAALALLARERPDIMLLDIQMPRLSGLRVLEQLRAVSPNTRVIIMTTFAQDEMVFQAVRLGAKGYLLKESTAAELIAAIRTVAAGGTLLTPTAAERLAERLHRQDALTAREREVLTLVAEGLRNKEIAGRLGTTEKTVQFHTANIFGKLGAQSRTEAVRIAIERGLILTEV